MTAIAELRPCDPAAAGLYHRSAAPVSREEGNRSCSIPVARLYRRITPQTVMFADFKYHVILSHYAKNKYVSRDLSARRVLHSAFPSLRHAFASGWAIRKLRPVRFHCKLNRGSFSILLQHLQQQGKWRPCSQSAPILQTDRIP